MNQMEDTLRMTERFLVKALDLNKYSLAVDAEAVYKLGAEIKKDEA
jgi:hypothetical protein